MNRARTEGITFTKEPFLEDAGPRRIKNMKFSSLSESDISKIGEVQVYKGSYYDSLKKPIHGGLLDPRMGPANKNLVCATCHGNFHDCPGHFGYLHLALPVFNVGYLSAIVEILKCICKGCARILLDEDTCRKHLKRMRSSKRSDLDKSDFVKLRIIKDCSKVVNCPRCGYVNGSVKKVPGSLTIMHDCSKCRNDIIEELELALSRTKDSRTTANVSTQFLNPFQVLSLFKRMTDEDCELLYVAERPERLIIKNIIVPPIAIRPSVVMDESLSNENDITERLKNIIQANAVLRQELQESSVSSKFQVGWDTLQYEVAQFINSDVRGIPFFLQSAKQLAGLVQRMKGKQGRIRNNLSGKRSEYTGRTVISPDPNLKITEVAVPIHMARILTYPERVTHHNIEKLRQCVRNGPDKYPGARMLKRDGGHSWSLKVRCRKLAADELRIGDIVDRHLEDGDVVLFNRQPSLHRMSIMCHRAKIMPWRTLRFNESVCNPYNADFDGDEMNLHVPQTEEARAEAILLMGVQNNLCTPKNGEILVASTQDFLTSSFLITRKDTFYDRSTFSLICSYIGDGMDPVDLPTPAIVKPVELWSGKQLFSIILRPHANMRVYVNLTVIEKEMYTRVDKGKRELKSLCPNDGFVYFRNSELISGQVGKSTLGNGNKDGLFCVLLRDYKAHAAASCMNRLAKLSARWIGNHGFSIGIEDVQPKETLIRRKDETISVGYGKCDGHIEEFNKGKLKVKAGCDAAQSLEGEISDVLSGIRGAIGKVCMQTLHWRNSPLIMTQCGSKGSALNICQMVACVGQQIVGGRRAPNGFIDRSLPHFPRREKTPAAKGFVANSFYSGLSATEFFFHTMAGREGLVDTAVKTADTGYMSRQLMKSLEDLFLHYDYTVRNAGGSIVQFCYGDDGMDPVAMEGKDGKPLNFERLFLKSKATCPSDEDDEILSSSDMCKVVHEKLSEFSMSRLVEKGVLEDDILSFIKKSTKLTEAAITNDISQNLKKFGQRISGTTRRQLEVFMVLFLKLDLFFLLVSHFFLIVILSFCHCTLQITLSIEYIVDKPIVTPRVKCSTKSYLYFLSSIPSHCIELYFILCSVLPLEFPICILLHFFLSNLLFTFSINITIIFYFLTYLNMNNFLLLNLNITHKTRPNPPKIIFFYRVFRVRSFFILIYLNANFKLMEKLTLAYEENYFIFHYFLLQEVHEKVYPNSGDGDSCYTAIAFSELTAMCLYFRLITLVNRATKQADNEGDLLPKVFLDTCLSRYLSKKVEAGAPVGATGAHSIGEPGTQMTLKTFHFAGLGSMMNVTGGVPRIKEIINGNKKISTPIIIAQLEREDDENIAKIVKGRIEKTNLGQVAKSIKVVMTSRSAAIVITLDMKRIENAHLNIDANIVKESILRTKKTKLKPEHIKILDIKKLEVVPQDADRSKIHFQLNYLKNLLPSVVVKGIKTAGRVVTNKKKDKETGKETGKMELLVEGTGLQEVMGVDGVDGRNTVTNHIHEVWITLGIEAARKCIVDEIMETMKTMKIDIRHMMLLADVMTATGHILGINRFGISKMGKSVLMLASFERTADILFQASVRGRDDSIGGVSESIIMGIPIQIGTGMIKVKQRLDIPELPHGASPILS
uniref:DNA-directed RNA polymerase subunit n=1 Tax=Cajanus cajan TaxID=3821 RepID=A0A151TZ64_CAJCA|nr:DNA-directed RNA polymerase III subunit rpc1 [Cajanus cajan]